MIVALVVFGVIVVALVAMRVCGREVRHVVEVDSQFGRITDVRRRRLENEIARGLRAEPPRSVTADQAAGNDRSIEAP